MLENVDNHVYATTVDGDTEHYNLTGVDDDQFWDVATEEVRKDFQSAEYELHIMGFRS